jgi:hypothetical protein
MRLTTCITLLLTLFIVSCSTPKLAVHDDLKPAHDEYTVKGRQGILIKQKMSFGEFATSFVKRSWTREDSKRIGIANFSPMRQKWIHIISTEYMQRRQTIHYSLTQGSLQSEVFCVSQFNSRNVEIGSNPNSILNIGMDLLGLGGSSQSMYYVQIFASANDDQPWELALDNQAAQATPRQYTGMLAKSKTEYYTIVPARKMIIRGKEGNSLMGSVGFEFRNKEGKTVAAVSLMDRGMIYLAKTTAEERFLLANACAALLLQEQIG